MGGAGGSNCIDGIIGAGYGAPPAPACSECRDNSVDLSAPCKVMIDCLESRWPCTQSQSCWLECLHAAQGSGVLERCVSALTATCP
jgi:hypothetical protein